MALAKLDEVVDNFKEAASTYTQELSLQSKLFLIGLQRKLAWDMIDKSNCSKKKALDAELERSVDDFYDKIQKEEVSAGK